MSSELGWWAYCSTCRVEYFYFAGSGVGCDLCESSKQKENNRIRRSK